MNEDETQRMHKRISDLSLAVIFTSLAVILLSLGLLCFNLRGIVEAWGRVL
jgi:hypothetical protein